MSRIDGYQGNPNLPRFDYKHIFSQHELDEFKKCAVDPIYFAKNYIKIVNVDRGLVPFEMWDFQEKMFLNFHENRFSINLCPRQVGKTTCAVSFILHYILFNESVNVAILANKAATSREIMSRLQLSFEYLPNFLKMGVIEWNKGSIVLANGSKVQADSTSGSSIRGRSFNIIFLDEFSFVPNNIAEAFFSSTYPTISSGKTTKVIIVSTPNGVGNLFYKLWMDATEKRNLYSPFSVHWSQVPGRDENWKEETIRNTSEQQFRAEFECEFLGSNNTLISGTKLRSLKWTNPIRSEGKLDIYEDPIPEHVYVMTVDVSEGQNLDYSAYSIIDVTEIPYRQVAKFRDNTIQPMLLPTLIYSSARKYNDAFVLVEINSIGLQVSDMLHFELAYENLIKIEQKGKQGQQYTPGFKKKIGYGLRQSVQTKKIGCANLKTIIENDKLIINDSDTIMELTTFSASKQSFAAEEGNNDDLVMTLVNFGWLTGQKFFKENIKNDIRKALQAEQLQIMDSDLTPFIVDDGLGNNLDLEKDKDLWVLDRESKYVFDNIDFDTLSNKHRL